MGQVTAVLVKQLREKTGAGMMDCKRALSETDADLEAATDWLRKKGLAAAARKAGRIASEGLVGVKVEGTRGALVEINSETDFVARNDDFQALVRAITDLAPEADGDAERLQAMALPGSGRSVSDEITQAIATIGENISFRRTAALEVDQGVVASYVHSQLSPGLGKIGVLVALKSAGDAGELEALGRQIAMHVPRPSRNRSASIGSTRRPWRASARSIRTRRKPAASPTTSSRRWSMAACASSTRRPSSSSRSSSSTPT